MYLLLLLFSLALRAQSVLRHLWRFLPPLGWARWQGSQPLLFLLRQNLGQPYLHLRRLRWQQCQALLFLLRRHLGQP